MLVQYVYLVTTGEPDSHIVGVFSNEPKAKRAQDKIRVQTFIKRLRVNELHPIPIDW